MDFGQEGEGEAGKTDRSGCGEAEARQRGLGVGRETAGCRCRPEQTPHLPVAINRADCVHGRRTARPPLFSGFPTPSRAFQTIHP